MQWWRCWVLVPHHFRAPLLQSPRWLTRRHQPRVLLRVGLDALFALYDGAHAFAVSIYSQISPRESRDHGMGGPRAAH